MKGTARGDLRVPWPTLPVTWNAPTEELFRKLPVGPLDQRLGSHARRDAPEEGA